MKAAPFGAAFGLHMFMQSTLLSQNYLMLFKYYGKVSYFFGIVRAHIREPYIQSVIFITR